MTDPRPVRAHPFWLAWANRPQRAIAVALAVSIGCVLATLALEGMGELGWRIATRRTAQIAFVLFLPTFVASSLARLFPGPRTRALVARRRAFGLAFASALLVHGVAILSLARAARAATEVLEPGLALYGGGLGFVLTGAMAATSSNAAQRRLGMSRWRALHGTGQTVLFVIFGFTYFGRIAGVPDAPLVHWLGFALVLLAVGLRVAAAIQSRSLRSRTLPIE